MGQVRNKFENASRSYFLRIGGRPQIHASLVEIPFWSRDLFLETVSNFVNLCTSTEKVKRFWRKYARGSKRDAVRTSCGSGGGRRFMQVWLRFLFDRYKI